MITLTDSATIMVRQLLDAEGDPSLFLRVAARPGGCSGFSYEMFFDSEVYDDDVEADLGEIRIVVDPDSAQVLEGVTLDYVDAPHGGAFAVSNPNPNPNPNASRGCNCGQSCS